MTFNLEQSSLIRKPDFAIGKQIKSEISYLTWDDRYYLENMTMNFIHKLTWKQHIQFGEIFITLETKLLIRKHSY